VRARDGLQGDDVRLSYRTELEGSHWRWRIFSNSTVILQGLAPTRAEAVASVRELRLFIRAPQLARITREPLADACTSRSPPIKRATVVTSRAERYRQLARACLQLANMFPGGVSRDTLIEMAHEWARLVKQEDPAVRAMEE
jgi:hypothetical protein